MSIKTISISSAAAIVTIIVMAISAPSHAAEKKTYSLDSKEGQAIHHQMMGAMQMQAAAQAAQNSQALQRNKKAPSEVNQSKQK